MEEKINIEMEKFNLSENTVKITKNIYIQDNKTIILVGDVKLDDSTHNCDEMGCGCEHIIFRGTISQFCKKYHLQYCNQCDDLECGDNPKKNEPKSSFK